MMKHMKGVSALLLCLLMMCLLPSCGIEELENLAEDLTLSGESAEETTAQTEPPLPPLILFEGGKSEYAVIRPIDLKDTQTAEVTAALRLTRALEAAMGGTVPMIVDYGTAPRETEICVGAVSRLEAVSDIDLSTLSDNEFLARVSGQRLVLIGKTAYGTARAVDWFTETYLTEGGMESLSVPADLSYVGSFALPDTLRVMTQNLLSGDSEYAELMKEERWASRITADLKNHDVVDRQPRVLSLIETYLPDSLGVQECSSAWRSYFDLTLGGIGYRRIGADKNPKIGILYRVDTVRPVADGSIWLTESPEQLKISEEWGEPADELIERVAPSPDRRVFKGQEKLLGFWRDCFERCERGNLDLFSEAALLYTVANLAEVQKEKNELTDKICEYTNKHFSTPTLCLSDLASRFGYDAKYLSALFKAKKGIAFTAYLRSVRVKHAAFLMDEGVESVKSIAMLSGFSDALYFSRIFKQETGVSPSAYMKRIADRRPEK